MQIYPGIVDATFNRVYNVNFCAVISTHNASR